MSGCAVNPTECLKLNGFFYEVDIGSFCVPLALMNEALTRTCVLLQPAVELSMFAPVIAYTCKSQEPLLILSKFRKPPRRVSTVHAPLAIPAAAPTRRTWFSFGAVSLTMPGFLAMYAAKSVASRQLGVIYQLSSPATCSEARRSRARGWGLLCKGRLRCQ